MGIDDRHRDKSGEISRKHGNTLVRNLRNIYGQTFAAGQPETAKLSNVLRDLNDTSLNQLVRDHATGHLEKKIDEASKYVQRAGFSGLVDNRCKQAAENLRVKQAARRGAGLPRLHRRRRHRRAGQEAQAGRPSPNGQRA
jgi:hypothetical protein